MQTSRGPILAAAAVDGPESSRYKAPISSRLAEAAAQEAAVQGGQQAGAGSSGASGTADRPHAVRIIENKDLHMHDRRIGRGGFGDVHAAKWMGIWVAIKELRGDDAMLNRDSAAAAIRASERQFLEEASMLLQHPTQHWLKPLLASEVSKVYVVHHRSALWEQRPTVDMSRMHVLFCIQSMLCRAFASLSCCALRLCFALLTGCYFCPEL